MRDTSSREARCPVPICVSVERLHTHRPLVHMDQHVRVVLEEHLDPVLATYLGLPDVDFAQVTAGHRPADQLVVGDAPAGEVGLGVGPAHLVPERDDQHPVSGLDEGLADQGEELGVAGDGVVMSKAMTMSWTPVLGSTFIGYAIQARAMLRRIAAFAARLSRAAPI